MKKFLRNLAVAAAFVFSVTAVSAQKGIGIPELTEGWNISLTRGNTAGTWFVTGTPHTRSIAVKDDKLFVLQCATYETPIIKIVDAATGKDTGKTLSVKGVSGGTWLISSLEVLGNDLIGSSFGSPAKVYRWKNCEGDPELLFTYPIPTGHNRFGENFGVYGDENNGKIMFVSTPTTGNPSLFVFDIVNGVANSTPTIITCDTDLAGYNSTSSALYYGNDQYVIITKDNFPHLIDSNGKTVADLTSKLSSKFGSSGEIFTFNGRTYFAGVGTRSSGYGKGVLDVVDITDGFGKASTEFTYPEDANGLGDVSNSQVVTDVEYTITRIKEGTVLRLFVLVPAQGAAMYTYTLPAEKLYVAQGKELDTSKIQTIYADEDDNFNFDLATVDEDSQYFRISTNNGDEFENGLIGVASNGNYKFDLEETPIIEKNVNNFMLTPSLGIWQFTIDTENNISVAGFVPEEIVFVPANGDKVVLEPKFEKYDTNFKNGEFVYEMPRQDLYGKFHLEFDHNGKTYRLGAKANDTNIKPGTTEEMWFNAEDEFDFNVDQASPYTFAKITAYYQVIGAEPSYVRLSLEGNATPNEEITRHHHAYNLSVTKPAVVNGDYIFKFHSTGEAANAYIHFHHDGFKKDDELEVKGAPVDRTEDGLQTYEVGPVEQGENVVVIPSTWFARANHDWEVELVNYPVEKDQVTDCVNVGGERAAVGCFTDPNYPAVYGYTVIGRATNTGIDIYDPTGKLVNSKLFVNNEIFGGAGANNPMDATPRGNEMYFASWNDKAYGVAAFNVTTPNVAPYSVFSGTKATNGLITTGTNNTIKVGSGTPCVGIWGEGDETSIIVFDEDIFGNKLAKNVIGTKTKTSNPLELIGDGYQSNLQNKNVSVATNENGFFIAQIRANGMDTDNYSLAYIEMPSGKMTWKILDQTTDINFLPSCGGGVDISPDGKYLAVSTYNDIRIFKLSWNEKIPYLEPYSVIANTFGRSDKRTILKFDAANNIHAVNIANGYFKVTPKEADGMRVKTAAPLSASFVVNDTATGVENIAVDETDSEAVYYNLNGVRMESGKLPAGVYVKVVGKKATKVVVK